MDNVFDAHPHGWAESNDVLCWVKHAGASSRARFAGFEAQHLIPKDNISLVERQGDVYTTDLQIEHALDLSEGGLTNLPPEARITSMTVDTTGVGQVRQSQRSLAPERSTLDLSIQLDFTMEMPGMGETSASMQMDTSMTATSAPAD